MVSSMIEVKDLFRGIFLVLGPLSAWVAWRMWRRIAWPAIRRGDLIEHTFPVGKALICTGLAIECMLYGLVRWAPAQLAWLGNVWLLVAAAKALMCVGMILVAATAADPPMRAERLRTMMFLCLAVWAAGVLMSAFVVGG